MGFPRLDRAGRTAGNKPSPSALPLRDQVPAAVLSEPLEMHGHIGIALSPGAPTLERKTHIRVNVLGVVLWVCGHECRSSHHPRQGKKQVPSRHHRGTCSFSGWRRTLEGQGEAPQSLELQMVPPRWRLRCDLGEDGGANEKITEENSSLLDSLAGLTIS